MYSVFAVSPPTERAGHFLGHQDFKCGPIFSKLPIFDQKTNKHRAIQKLNSEFKEQTDTPF